MTVVQPNSVVESKMRPGLEVRLLPEVGASFSICVARSKKGRGIGDRGYGVRACQRNARRGTGKREPVLVLALESLQDAERAVGTVDGGKFADSSCTSAINGGVNW